MIKNLSLLEKKLNIRIKNTSIYDQAFTHKSSNRDFNNEKLEFLGDRVIGLILSKKLYDLYPKENEGVLDKRFANLVNKNTCASVFWSLNINDFIVLGDPKKKIKKTDKKILSDSCEALIGAIYLEKGFNFTETYVLKLWKDEINKSKVTIIDSKTLLQEYSLKLNSKLPFYKDESQKGPRHKPIFRVSVKISGSKTFIGEGSSKKNAQQDAAKKLLKNINIT